MKIKKLLGIVLLVSVLGGMLSGCGKKAPTTASVSKPVKLSIIDVAGNLQLSQPAIDAFKAANPNLVSDIEVMKATAPELPSKLKAQIAAKNVQTTMVLTGYDGLASSIEQDVIEKIMPTYKDRFPGLEGDYLPGAKKAYEMAKGYGIAYVYCPGGPMFTYNPDKVKNVPKTPDELLAWAKANPGKFLYARPANSGPGRAFLQGLPYILKDKNPKDPKTWDKTWAFLKELDKYIDYYPSGTGVTFKELGEGTRYMIASHLGWDMNQRILGTIPANYQGFFLDKTTWVTDAHYMVIPKGLDNDKKEATLALMQWLMKPDMQAITYDSGYFYPGPAVKNVKLSMAPKDSQTKIQNAIRDTYEKAIKDLPNEPQLDSKPLVEAMDMWDKLVGAKVK